MVVSFAPSQLSAKVESIHMHHELLKEAIPGDNIGFHVKNLTKK